MSPENTNEVFSLFTVITGEMVVLAKGAPGPGWPEATGMVVAPMPTRYTEMYSPGCAGDASVMAPPFWWPACTNPVGSTESPGEAAPAWKLCGNVSALFAFTIT